MRALINELSLGIKRIHMSTDASAARAMSQRTSVPTRAKQMIVRFLYLQQLIGTKHIRSEILTKHVKRDVHERLRSRFLFAF